MSALRNFYNHVDDISKQLMFEVDKKYFLLSISYIRQILQGKKVEYLHKESNKIKGYIKLYDKVIPIIDIRDKLGAEVKAIKDNECLIILQVYQKHVGIIVDRVINTVAINHSQIYIEEPDISINSIVSGSFHNQHGQVYIIDPYRLS